MDHVSKSYCGGQGGICFFRLALYVTVLSRNALSIKFNGLMGHSCRVAGSGASVGTGSWTTIPCPSPSSGTGYPMTSTLRTNATMGNLSSSKVCVRCKPTNHSQLTNETTNHNRRSVTLAITNSLAHKFNRLSFKPKILYIYLYTAYISITWIKTY